MSWRDDTHGRELGGLIATQERITGIKLGHGNWDDESWLVSVSDADINHAPG